MQRSAEEVELRCKPVINNSDIIRLIDTGTSPTAVHQLILTETKDEDTAKAARWLAILKRDYPDRYRKLIQPVLSHVTNDTAQKGQVDENRICTKPTI
jgi:hypothetical protein